MRTAVLVVCSAVLLLLAACSDGEEDVPADSQSTDVAAPTVTWPPGDVIICARFGDGSTPTTATPVPSCTPADSLDGDLSLARLTEAVPPPLPAGFTALTSFYTVDPALVGEPGQVNLDTTGAWSSAAAWYTYDGTWSQVNASIRPLGPADHPVANGTFDTLPANIIVLAEAE
jgi:hypothetical protein